MLEHLERAERMIGRDYGLIADSFRRNRDLFGEPWAIAFNDLLRTALSEETSLRRALTGYTAYAVDQIRWQILFQKELKYAGHSYEQANREVYQNEQYMSNEYLQGALLNHYLWTHHYRHLLFFTNIFLVEMAAKTDQRFHDVGIGTGFYTDVVLSNIPGAHGIGWDISPHSLSFARQFLARHGGPCRYELRLKDVLTEAELEPLPFLISMEILEQFEDPISFLKCLYRMLLKNGKAFITAAVNAPQFDHIYLYRNDQEILEQIRSVGFQVETVFHAYAYPPTRRIPVVPSIVAVMATK